MRLVLLALCFVHAASGIANETLIDAFVEVFEIKDVVGTVAIEPIQLALSLLRVQHVDFDNICSLSDEQQARMLMRNARAIVEQQLQDKQDWRIYVHRHGFRRERSYDAVRFAVVETLLLVTVTGLGYLIWVKLPFKELDV